ncbi:MAG: HAD-IB family phosphatase [bacterium]
MKIAIFDFDGTIYKGDSYFTFCKYIYRKFPLRLRFFFPQAIYLVLYFLGILKKNQMKSLFLVYLQDIAPVKLRYLLDLFWEINFPISFNKEVLGFIEECRKRGMKIYCITASPELFILPIQEKLQIDKVIGTIINYDGRNHYIDGLNCRGKEKINRLKLLMNDGDTIDFAISDNKDDNYLFEIARESYFIRGGKINKYEKKIKPSEFSSLLRKNKHEAKLIDSLKIIYRPYVCPFNDIIKEIEPRKKILDIGSGSGQLALILCKYVKPLSIGGLEISRRLVENAKKILVSHEVNEVEFKFEVYDGYNLPDSISIYDYVTLIDVFHHIPVDRQKDFLELQLSRKVKKGTILILKDIDAGSPLVYCNKLHDYFFSGNTGNEVSFIHMKKLLEKNNWKILSSYRKRLLWFPHYFMIAQKI